MDLNQRKLNKSEWESIEIPVSKAEKEVLTLIMKGYHDVNIHINHHDSIFSYLKIEYSEKMEDFIYNSYLKVIVDGIINLFKIDNIMISVNPNIKINSADKIRLEKNTFESLKKINLYEYILLSHLESFLILKTQYAITPKDVTKTNYIYHYYTLYNLLKNSVQKINRHIVLFCKTILDRFSSDIEMFELVENAVELIEKNNSLLKYQDMILYEHQKEIFTICKNSNNPKLILYMAPTGTGKTMTPIGLSENFRIIFLCAARHVGLALARAAISINKKIAFAFGCSSADDIRLHYFAAKDYTVNKRTGAIKKVDNSNGINVEIIISDIRSFVPAMLYMCAFNPLEKLIVYWDEPTITLDYKEHEFHSIIKKNWSENLIPTVILSSATLPKEHELVYTIADFSNKFKNAEVHNIVSHDCKKSIPIINTDGFVVLPHYLSNDYDYVKTVVNHCEQYLTLLRYFDLEEVVKFIIFVNKQNFVKHKFKLVRYFDSIDDINMKNIKLYYLKLLNNIFDGTWGAIYTEFYSFRRTRIEENDSVDTNGLKISKSRSIGPGVLMTNKTNQQSTTVLNVQNELEGLPLSRLKTMNNIQQPKKGTSGIYVTTKDSYTLTDGPTIFICDNIEKIAKFCIQQANIPSVVMTDLMEKINYNNVINEKLSKIEKDLDFLKEEQENKLSSSIKSSIKGKSMKNIRKFNREADNIDESKGQISKLTREIEEFKKLIKPVILNDTFIPNKHHHIIKWAEDMKNDKAFTSDIEEHYVNEIMLLNGIDDNWKILLMMGIGVFINHENIKYTEIMKKLADEQKLYMILASSDYIYGTNYQFCHGYLSKNMMLSQEKIIQAMGRVGRNNIQQTYSLRFRDDDMIKKIFTHEENKPEIINMNLLFNSNKIVWNGESYNEIIEENKEEDNNSNYEENSISDISNES